MNTLAPSSNSGQIILAGTLLSGLVETDYIEANILLSLIFVIDRTAGASSDIIFDGSLNAIEFINSSFENVPVCNIFNGSISISGNPPPSPSDFEVSIVPVNALCNQSILGSITANGFFGTPPYTYAWTGSNGFTSTAQNIIELEPGLYNLTATDSDGATSVINDIVIEEVGGDFEIEVDVQNNYCDTGMEGFIKTKITLNNTEADLNFAWSNGETSSEITNLSNGLYTLTITDNVGCTQTHEYEISSSRAFMVNFDTGASCEGASSGFIYPSIFSDDLSFFWSNGAVTDSIQNLAAGTYEVTIQEPQGCAQIKSIELEEIIENSSLIIDASCSSLGLDNGSFFANFIGDLEGTSIGIEFFDSSGNTPSPIELAPGAYTLMATSVNGCIYEDSFVIEESLSDYTEEYYSCLLDSVQMVTFSNNPDLLYSWSPDTSFVMDSVANPIFLDAEFANPSFTATLLTTGAQGCTRSFDFNIIQQDACVWPGDTNEDNMVSAADLLHIGIANGSSGPARPMPNITDWATQSAVLWNENIGTTTLDKMFADCNGDGAINDEDIRIVEQNNGLSHLGFTSETETDRAMGPPLFIDLLSTYQDGVEAEINIVLGDMTDQATDAYGVAFQIVYDSNVSVITQGSFQEQGWLSSDQSNTWDIEFNDAQAGVIDVAVTRTNGLGLDGFGPIASFRSTIFGAQKSEIEFDIINAIFLNSNAVDMPLQTESSLSVIGTSSARTLNSDLYNESISPNPSSDFIVIRSDRAIDTYLISNAIGQVCKYGVLSQGQINIYELIPGMYTIQLEGEDGITAHKLIVK